LAFAAQLGGVVFPGGQDCACPAIASDVFQKSLAQGLVFWTEKAPLSALAVAGFMKYAG